MNNLTGLVPTIYTAMHMVSRELIGFIPNVSTDVAAEGAAVGQTIRAPIAGTSTLEDIVPGNDPNDSGDSDQGYTDVTITKSKAYPIRWTGEEQLALSRYGEYNTILADQFAEGFRMLANAVEGDLGSLYAKSARVVGTAGTTPFGTKDNHMDFANANRALDELGAPQSGRVMVVGSAARANIEGIQSGLFKVNEAGDNGALLRNREGRNLHGFDLGYSAGVAMHTPGDAADYLVNGTEATKGMIEVSVDTGTGSFVPGDVVQIAGQNYVVADYSAGTLTLGKPGLVADAADDAAITAATDGYTANMFYHRSALLLAARAPAMPEGGDEATDVMTVTDPISGLSFQVAMYKQYRRIKYEIGLAWGVAAPNGKFSGVLMG